MQFNIRLFPGGITTYRDHDIERACRIVMARNIFYRATMTRAASVGWLTPEECPLLRDAIGQVRKEYHKNLSA